MLKNHLVNLTKKNQYNLKIFSNSTHAIFTVFQNQGTDIPERIAVRFFSLEYQLFTPTKS